MHTMKHSGGSRKCSNGIQRSGSMIVFLFLESKRASMRHKRIVIKLLVLISIVYQLVRYRRYWSGFWDSWRVILQYLRPTKFQKQIHIASDSEEYVVWIRKRKQTTRNSDIAATNQKPHLWICLPSGMQSNDFSFDALIANQAFKGSEVCVFNNPGIATRMFNNPLPSPTETKYIIEYIERQREEGYRVSLIGFSIGSVRALRVLHEIQNDPQRRDRIKLESVILVHGPDIVREVIQNYKNYWFIRMDIYFAGVLWWLQYHSGSWEMIKDKMTDYSVFQGWPFIERVGVVSSRKPWEQCEKEMYNLRNFCDLSIQECDTKVYRIVAKNDWVIPFELIDPKYFKFLDQVFVSERGGHCGITQCPETVSLIASWNEDVLRNGYKYSQQTLSEELKL